MSDFAEWFGLDGDIAALTRYERGQITFQELATESMKNAAKAPVNKVVQGLNPFLKSPLTVFGLNTYPDVFEARPFAKSFSSKAIERTVLELLGSDVKRFVDIGKGKRTLGEVLSYYFSGSSYRRMTAEDLLEEINRRVPKKPKSSGLGIPGPKGPRGPSGLRLN
jgi:hypothetical protein